MEELRRKINYYWLEIRELPRQPLRAKKFLQIKEAGLAQLTQNLRESTEEGVLEYKRRSFNKVFQFLAHLSRSTPTHTELLKEKEHIRLLMYLLILQNSFHNGTNLPPKEKVMEEGPKRLPVAKIIQELQQQISRNPEMKNQQEVKNLFIDFSMYKREHENFAKLSPNISDDRAPTFFSNFKEKIDAIVDDINRSYHKIITEEERENKKKEQTVKRSRYQSDQLSQIQLSLSQELTRILVTLDVALQEAFQFREPLLKLTERKEPVFLLLEEERNKWLREEDKLQGAVTLGRIMAEYIQEKTQD
jgi:hypothetical protein